MDSCLLCLELNKDLLDSISVHSTQWKELNITNVLEKHFWPLNTIHPKSRMCLSCWEVVNHFHKFYLQIEEAHTNFLKIKVEGKNRLPPSLEDISSQENFPYCCLEPEILINQNSYEDLLDEENSQIKTNKNNKNDFNEIKILNEDPLEKYELTKRSNRKITRSKISKQTKSPRQNAEETNIKSEPADSSDSDFSALSGEDDPNEELDKNLETGKNKNREENDKIIAEHFKQMFCDLCGVVFENFLAMQKHFTMIHDQNGYLVCCNRKFYQRYRLVDHLHCHLNPDHFKCTQCCKVLSNRKNLKNHMLRAHRPKDVVLEHSCDICGKSFTQGSLLRKHKLKHLPEEEKKFPCSECGKFYATSYLLNRHTQAVHLKKFIKICYICGKYISTSAEYKIHMDKHEGIPQPVISCDVCGLRVTSERGLKRHKETQHPVGGKQDHHCPMCPKVSPTLKALRKHIKTMHEESYNHKCTICEKAFKRAEVLREHMASHTGTPLYTCPWCPRTFNSNGNMHAHRKKIHPKESEEAKLQKYSGNLSKQQL